LLSLGFPHDKFIKLWDWKSGALLALHRTTAKVHALAFSPDDRYFVTAGQYHLKIWSAIDPRSGAVKTSEKTFNGTKIFDGRSAILASRKEHTFTHLAFPSSEKMFVVTEKGSCCVYDLTSRTCEKLVELKVDSIFSVSIYSHVVAFGCSHGYVRLFDARNLAYIATFPRPFAEEEGKHPNVVAIRFSGDGKKVAALYSNRSFFLWDVSDPNKISKSRSFLAHSACIWDVKMLSCARASLPLPPGSFVTGSGDGTIRFWNLSSPSRNVYSKDLLHSITLPGDCGGVRKVAISPDARHVASGDRRGNLRIHEIASGRLLQDLEAHEGEILALDYSPSTPVLASGSRDRLVHVFEGREGGDYRLSRSLDEHSSTVTSLSFSPDGNALISCGADKSLVFRHVNHATDVVSYHRALATSTLYDLEVGNNGKVWTGGSDGRLFSFDLGSGKKGEGLKGEGEGGGEIFRIALDPSSQFISTAAADRSVRVFREEDGECVGRGMGHVR